MNNRFVKTCVGACILFLTAAAPSFAQTYTQDFETGAASFFQTPVNGVSCDGSTIETTEARAHSGKKSAKLAYKFSGKGYVNLVTPSFPEVVTKGGTLHLSVWVYGAGRPDLTGVGLDLIDDSGETYQFGLGPEFATALAGNGWQQVQFNVDVTKPNGHWGGKYTGGIKMPFRLLGFGIGFEKDAAAQGEVFFDDISLTGDPPAPPAGKAAAVAPTASSQPAVSVTLKPTAAQQYLYPVGSVVHASVQSAALSSSSLRWIARDFSGAVLTQGTVHMDGSGAGRFDVPARKPGIIYVKVGADASTQFAVLAPEPQAKRSTVPLPIVYGVNAGLEHLTPDQMERAATLISSLGFRACRSGCDWDAVQPARDVWHWDKYDQAFAVLKRHGIIPQTLLAYTARWASTGDPNAANWHDWANAPPVTVDYAKFAGEAARRYRSQGHYWEIWNEPDIDFWLGTPQQYATMFDAASAAIKAADPNAKVMNGGFSETKRRPNFIPDWQRSAQAKPDIFAFHSHMIFANMIRANDTVQTLYHDSGWNMPKWMNEAGYSSFGNLTERDQALALVKKMTAAPALGIKGYFWYDLINDGTDASDPEHNFGLMRADYTPKAAAVAAHTLLSLLNGQTFVRRLTVPGTPDAYALLYGNTDGQGGTLVLWNEADSVVPLFWRTVGARRVSIMGASSPLPSRGGLAALPAAPEPQFLAFSGPVSQFKVAGRLLDFSSPLVAAPGDTVPLRVTIHNPFPHPLRGAIALQGAEAWHRAKNQMTATVPANGTKTLTVAVTAPGTRQSRSALTLSFTSPDLAVKPEGAVSLQQMTVVPRIDSPTPLGDFSAWQKPTVTLGRDNIVSLYEATPMQELLYHGPTDLSARVYLARVPTGLRVAVRVQDDIFKQDQAPGTEWQGDSVQMGLALPSGESYEWIAALTPTGPAVSLDISPADKGLGKLNVPVSIQRVGSETLYDLVLPTALPDGKTLGNRFSFSLLVNDNDGAGRKGWIEWTPGIGRSKDPSEFEPVVVR